MNSKGNILAIGAHPDDIELLCGGTLAKYSKLGHKVYMYHACDGDKGGLHKKSEEIINERREEANNSAKVINAVSFVGDFRDGEVTINLENRLLLIDVIRQCDPTVIFTHSPYDYHTDHLNTSKLVFEASYMVNLPKLKTSHKATKILPRLFYFDTISGVGFNPVEYVDITDVIDLKIKMMMQHKSQILFIKKYHNVDLLEMIKINGKYRGFQCNAEYAEGFVECIAWPRKTAKRILP